jgi:hypothetical protein
MKYDKVDTWKLNIDYKLSGCYWSEECQCVCLKLINDKNISKLNIDYKLSGCYWSEEWQCVCLKLINDKNISKLNIDYKLEIMLPLWMEF